MVHGLRAKRLPDSRHMASRLDPGQDKDARTTLIVDCTLLGEDYVHVFSFYHLTFIFPYVTILFFKKLSSPLILTSRFDRICCSEDNRIRETKAVH